MSLEIDLKAQASAKTDSVWAVDFHPTEPWVLCALENGKVRILDTNTGQLVRNFDVSSQGCAVRCARFVPRKQWVIASTNNNIRVWHYHTTEIVKAIEDSHDGLIRCLAVHPTLPYLVSGGQDKALKLWDWDQDWACTTTAEAHTSDINVVQWHPFDLGVFVSGSEGGGLKVWSAQAGGKGTLTLSMKFGLKAHDSGVRSIAFNNGSGSDKMVTGGADNTVRVWDFNSRHCLYVLNGHSDAVTGLAFCPELPLLFSVSEDGTVRVWNGTTFMCEKALQVAVSKQPVWALRVKGANTLAVGHQQGAVILRCTATVQTPTVVFRGLPTSACISAITQLEQRIQAALLISSLSEKPSKFLVKNNNVVAVFNTEAAAKKVAQVLGTISLVIDGTPVDVKAEFLLEKESMTTPVPLPSPRPQAVAGGITATPFLPNPYYATTEGFATTVPVDRGIPGPQYYQPHVQPQYYQPQYYQPQAANLNTSTYYSGMMTVPAQPAVVAQPQPQNVHQHAACDVCQTYPIVGFRHKCADCPNYDLCDHCIKNKDKLHPGHRFICIAKTEWKEPTTGATGQPVGLGTSGAARQRTASFGPGGGGF